MKIIELVSRLPTPIANLVDIWANRIFLSQTSRLACETSRLGRADERLRAAVDHCDSENHLWQEALNSFHKCGLGNLSLEQSIEKRLLFHFARNLQPSSVLEIGSFLGHSALVFTSALTAARLKTSQFKICSVDIVDVNDASTGYWPQHGQRYSPQQMIHKIQPDAQVEFVQADSISFLNQSEDEFDLIFLDGHHRGTTVYRETVLALRRLRPGGHLLLHDYHPFHFIPYKRKIVPGPYLAVQRLIREGVPLVTLPLCTIPASSTKRVPTTLCVVAAQE